MKASSSMLLAVLAVATFLQGGVAAFEKCEAQTSFDIVMCKSHMCTECVLEWCMTTCQALQEDHAACRCESWPEAQKTYSDGDIKGKGKVGDAGEHTPAPAHASEGPWPRGQGRGPWSVACIVAHRK
eukprot:CAMPEP_0177421506 /NCGR_PEP_ID=MMETSP0368-20130122/70819_1 /TAXON_ID=447022 ORGANISM="Scrippsiella hangoei-like, Strain SHHI-4" /NCGR_SAMPLE_ID=MMETSP0368 /ASSEMBLY_ACC=CAM_ASM_000363 /LENGTH=126 /DNA_ID=CAMNT_0018891357 /DNA_START=78 /DNA_END=455 /DNA_ORIENTATION=-